MPRGFPDSTTPFDERDERQTPPYLFWFAEFTFGKCDIDLAATQDNSLCSTYFDRAFDGLAHPWHQLGNRGWCNPPYSQIAPWINGAIIEAAHGFETIMLIPPPNGAARDAWVFTHAHRLIFIVGRVKFPRPGAKKTSTGFQGSCLVQFGPGDKGKHLTVDWALRSNIEALYERENSPI